MSRLQVIIVLVCFAALAAIQVAGCGGSEAGAGLYPAPVEGKWGYIDKTGAWVIEPRFGCALEFSEGLAPARPYNDWRWGFVDTAGEFVIQPQFYSVGSFGEEGLSVVARDDAGAFTCGYIDKTGKDLTDQPFDDTWSFSEGLGLVRRGEAWGYIDTTGRIVIPLDFYMAEPFSEGLAAVRHRLGEPCGYIDKTGAWVIEPQFASADSFSEGLARIRSEAGYGFIDKSGTVVIPPQFEMVTGFSEGLAVVSKMQKEYSVPAGGPLGSFQYEDYGYIDTTGKLVIGGDFDYADRFVNGLAAVVVGGKWGYIDKSGAWVVEPGSAVGHTFDRDLAMVCLDRASDTWGYIDRTGAVVWKSGPGAYENHESSGASPPSTLFMGPGTSESGDPPPPQSW